MKNSGHPVVVEDIMFKHISTRGEQSKIATNYENRNLEEVYFSKICMAKFSSVSHHKHGQNPSDNEVYLGK